MKRISNPELLKNYIAKHDIENIFGKDLVSHMELHFYEKGTCIFKAESNLEYYYLLVDGKIRVSYPFENGKSMFLKFYKAFNTIGDLELLKNRSIICDIETTEDTYLIAISAGNIRRSYLDDPKFLRHLVDSLSDKLYATINNSSYNFVYPLINRFSSYLVEHITDGCNVVFHSSFVEIAQFLGTTYRHLNRTIKELEKKSIIKCEDKAIRIINEDKLRELSKNPYVKSL